MGKFVAASRVNEGIVLSFEYVTSEEKEPHLFKINEHNAILLIDDLEAGKNFCEKYLKDFKSQEWGFSEILKMIEEKMISHPDEEIKNKIITLAVVGYDEDFVPMAFKAYAFNGITATPMNYDIDVPHIFAIDNTLGLYLINKTYSKLMSIQQATKLLGYITLQYQNILSVLGPGLSMATITKEGYKKLTDKEITEVIRFTDSTDLNIKKDLIDLFIKESSK